MRSLVWSKSALAVTRPGAGECLALCLACWGCRCVSRRHFFSSWHTHYSSQSAADTLSGHTVSTDAKQQQQLLRHTHTGHALPPAGRGLALRSVLPHCAPPPACCSGLTCACLSDGISAVCVIFWKVWIILLCVNSTQYMNRYWWCCVIIY